ncbi:replication initiator [Microbispora siamensis]|nr:replication initiator [Microbispora siamensis]
MRMPLAREVAKAVAIENGVCIRSIPMRVIDTETGKSQTVYLPCNATLESRCPACAKRNRHLRMAQCREGWHLESEPVAETDEPDNYQRYLLELRADFQVMREDAERAGQPTEDLDLGLAELDAEIRAAGTRGQVVRATAGKRKRSTRRRQDAPDLPRRKMANTTLGRVYTSPDGKRYRPSMFITLTLPSYGRVRDGAPVDPASYDYSRAARDALHFSKLVDRFVQNLRRVAGYDVQYFASVEPQKRLAPHLHMAIRGTLTRADIRAVVAATYHQVWWPSCDVVRFDGDNLPVWVERPQQSGGDQDKQTGDYVDPVSGEVLPTWEEALDRLGDDEDAEPLHVVRFGSQIDVQGVLAGTRDADQCIRYLSKYLTKSIGGTIESEDRRRRDHAARLVEALRYEPCSPMCPNWLRYGVQPKNARAGMSPGRCKGRAHKPEHLGYGGRRVLVSRKWSNKTLAEHGQDRRAWVLQVLGIADDRNRGDAHRYVWRRVPEGDPGLPPLDVRLLHLVAQRQRWRRHLVELQARAEGRPADTLSAIDGRPCGQL